MKECTWKRQLQTMNKPPTTMGRILHTDTPDTLLDAIVNDEVFGFVRCDVHTPRELIESYGEFLFPPIFDRMQVTEDLMSNYMRERMIEDENEKEPTTIVQRYNAKGIYLMTPLVKFYISRGMKVSNITQFVQYIGGEAFDSFVETCYVERVAATKADDKTKANTIKNVQNNGYGKCGENVRRHKKVNLYVDEDKAEKQEDKPRYMHTVEIPDESGEPESWEITSRKKFVDDDKPVHFALAILQYSKLLFLE